MLPTVSAMTGDLMTSSASLHSARLGSAASSFRFCAFVALNGKVHVKVEPRPTTDWALICPPSPSTIIFDIERPSPVPEMSRVSDESTCSKGWKMTSSASGATPLPVSLT